VKLTDWINNQMMETVITKRHSESTNHRQGWASVNSKHHASIDTQWHQSLTVGLWSSGVI